MCFAPGQIRLVGLGMCTVREIDIIVNLYA